MEAVIPSSPLGVVRGALFPFVAEHWRESCPHSSLWGGRGTAVTILPEKWKPFPCSVLPLVWGDGEVITHPFLICSVFSEIGSLLSIHPAKKDIQY